MTLPAVRGTERKEIALQGALEHLAPGPWLERPDAPDAIVTAVRRLPPVDARYSPFPHWLDPRLQAAFERRGVTQLYCHQAEALTHVAAGRNIVVTTPTASGKTLCYNLPVLDAVLQNGAVFLFTTTPRMIETPISYQNVQLGEVRLPVARLYALILGVIAFGLLYLILHHTRLGKAMRGVAQNRAAAMMVGIDTRVVSRLAVAIGIGLSGLAGAALAPIYSVHPLMGFAFVFKAFAIIIIGGLGNVSGAAIAAVMLGVIESFAGGLLPLAMTDAVAFIAMIAVLLLRPQGLFGRGVRV